MPISAALRQNPHFKVASVASRWQRVGNLGDLIGSEIEPHTTCAICPVQSFLSSQFFSSIFISLRWCYPTPFEETRREDTPREAQHLGYCSTYRFYYYPTLYRVVDQNGGTTSEGLNPL